MSTRTDTAATPSTNGRGRTDDVRDMSLQPPPSARRVRIPELLIGAAIVVGFALAAVLWHSNSTQREPALALAADVERGDAISASDLEVVYLGTDDPIARLAPSESVDVIGRVAVADFQAGTLITSANVLDLPALAPGDGVVGLALDPGQYPAGRLSPGDVVNVVVPGDAEDGPIAESAVVFAIEELGGQGRRFISLQTSEEAANRIASAAEAGPVRLVLVAA